MRLQFLFNALRKFVALGSAPEYSAALPVEKKETTPAEKKETTPAEKKETAPQFDTLKQELLRAKNQTPEGELVHWRMLLWQMDSIRAHKAGIGNRLMPDDDAVMAEGKAVESILLSKAHTREISSYYINADSGEPVEGDRQRHYRIQDVIDACIETANPRSNDSIQFLQAMTWMLPHKQMQKTFASMWLAPHMCDIYFSQTKDAPQRPSSLNPDVLQKYRLPPGAKGNPQNS